MAPAQSREIPQHQWETFFEELNHNYQGADVTLEVVTPNDQPQLLLYGLPLAEVSCAESVTIRLGDGAQHMIEHATGIRLEGDADGLGLVVVIEAAGAAPTRLTLARSMQRIVGGATRAVAAKARVGDSAGASGDGRNAPGIGDDYGSTITFGSSDDMGGVADVGGGSLGDQDLSGRRSYDITADVYGGGAEELLDDAGEAGGHAGPGSETAYSGVTSRSQAQGSTGPKLKYHKPEIIDGGGDQGVIDPTADPIAGSKIDPANTAHDPYVEGEVGAQAERDLDDLNRDRPKRQRRRSP